MEISLDGKMQIKLEIDKQGYKSWYKNNKETWFYSPEYKDWLDLATKRYMVNRYDK